MVIPVLFLECLPLRTLSQGQPPPGPRPEMAKVSVLAGWVRNPHIVRLRLYSVRWKVRPEPSKGDLVPVLARLGLKMSEYVAPKGYFHYI